MAERVIFIGWDRAIIGREKQAMKLFQKVMKYCTKLQANGQIESYDLVTLTPHGGDLNVFLMLKGDGKKLADIQEDASFVQYVMESFNCLQGFGVITGTIGAGAIKVFSHLSKLMGS
jgi:hypothetical protein